ncbi:ATP-binding cassette domain-containing protein [Leucobacter insecticola]|uniref:ATP-binding cassette domain-containing protein n=1 Tax=Leucobacter insecticola TaxID=2714934 RepID=A0A6G8FFT4_9MICO|nr:ATP-binding cassette domain-containing protein [Leucobacter insecticola]QIM15194.1 ATP-binding cassette domain-containing protein [Leucobacter insecticola]
MTLEFDIPVRLSGAGRDFGAVRALSDVDLSITAGGTVGLLGPNGSGKTTMLSLISGLRVPSSGTVELFGCDPRDPKARVRLGVTPQHSGLVKSMTVLQLVQFIANHFVDHEPPEELLNAFGIATLANKRIGGLSGGSNAFCP